MKRRRTRLKQTKHTQTKPHDTGSKETVGDQSHGMRRVAQMDNQAPQPTHSGCQPCAYIADETSTTQGQHWDNQLYCAMPRANFSRVYRASTTHAHRYRNASLDVYIDRALLSDSYSLAAGWIRPGTLPNT